MAASKPAFLAWRSVVTDRERRPAAQIPTAAVPISKLGADLTISADANPGSASSPLVFNGGELNTRGTLTIARPIILNGSGGLFAFENSHTPTVTGPITGTGALTTATVGYANPSPPDVPPTPFTTLVLSGDNSYTGGMNINSGWSASQRMRTWVLRSRPKLFGWNVKISGILRYGARHCFELAGAKRSALLIPTVFPARYRGRFRVPVF